MKGKLIVIEGGDGSGKATQADLLYRRLNREGKPVYKVTFPDYDSPSSMLVKMYLQGQFGKQADSVNPYAASTFYAVDRFASYQMKWKTLLAQGYIIIADRYTTSNMLYQMIKISAPAARQAYLDWLWDFEFIKMGLPIPDIVILLDVPLAVTETLMAARQGKTGGETGDIHEKNRAFLQQCHAAYEELAHRYGWRRVACTTQGKMRSPQSIQEEVYTVVATALFDNREGHSI